MKALRAIVEIALGLLLSVVGFVWTGGNVAFERFLVNGGTMSVDRTVRLWLVALAPLALAAL